MLHREILSHKNIWKVVVAIFALVFIVQYLHDRSLWIDEAMLALNIIHRPLSGLVRPLDDSQVAPILFLFIEKFFVYNFGNSEFALRFFPLLCSIASLPLLYRLSLRLTGDISIALCTVILLGCAPSFVYYSSEVKQYAVDVLVILVLYNMAFAWPVTLDRFRPVLFGVAGAVAIFLSNVSVIVLFTIGCYFVFMSTKLRRIDRAAVIAALFWVGAFAFNYFLFIKDHPHTHYMRTYWHLSFMPLNPFTTAFRQFVDKSVAEAFRDLLPGLRWSYFFLITALVYLWGLWVIIREKAFLLLYLCVTPILLHLVLSAFELYPFSVRLILYQAPLYLLVIAFGLVRTIGGIRKASWRIISVVCFAIYFTFTLVVNFPLQHDEIKPAIADINRLSRPNEYLYLFSGSIPSAKYYMDTQRARFAQLRIIYGSPHGTTVQSYLDDLRGVKGPVWLLISHLYPYNGDRGGAEETVRRLSARGALVHHKEYPGSSLYRFELN